jgi:hypothetical protein
MATIVMYCDIPEVGGQTRFRNSNVHVIPKKYAATFFSYIDPATMKMDSGFTEHSGCPVVEGEKKIVTQWVRLGVDDENPWNSFNTRECHVSSSFFLFSLVPFLLTQVRFATPFLPLCTPECALLSPPKIHVVFSPQWASNTPMRRINKT